MATQNRSSARNGPRARHESRPETPGVLTDIFGKNSHVQTLEFLACNPDTVFLQEEIADEIDVSAPMISRVCRDLEAYNIIERADADSNDTYPGVTLADTQLGALMNDVVTEARRVQAERE